MKAKIVNPIKLLKDFFLPSLLNFLRNVTKSFTKICKIIANFICYSFTYRNPEMLRKLFYFNTLLPVKKNGEGDFLPVFPVEEKIYIHPYVS